MKKILFIDVFYNQGSTGKIVYNLHKSAQNDGFISAVAYGRGKEINEHNVFKFGIDIETKFHVLMNRITGVHGSFSLISTIRLIRFIDRFNPDIIHIHELHGYFVNINMLLKHLKNKKIKIIWTFHCEYMYEGKGHQEDEYDTNWNRKKEYPKSWFFDFSKWNVKRYEKTLKDFSDLTIITPSSWLKNKVSKTYLSKFKHEVINNGIDQNVFYYEEDIDFKENIGALNKKIILSVAPNIMSKNKGGKDVLNIAEKLRHKDYFFILIGHDNNMKVDNNLLVLERTKDQNELRKYYSNSDYFLITSIKENFPTTVLESISCGTRILGYDVGGISEIANIDHVKLFTPTRYLEIVEYLTNDIPKYNKSELLKISKRYSYENMYENYKKYYIK